MYSTIQESQSIAHDDVLGIKMPLLAESKLPLIGKALRCHKTKAVAFPSKIKTVDEKPQEWLSCEEVDLLWWTKKELLSSRSCAKDLSKQIRQSEMECTPITMALKKTKLMLGAEIQKLVRLPLSRPDEDLQEWCANDDGRRGLEKYASKEYAILRHGILCSTRIAVLTEQTAQHKQGICDEELIAESSRKMSRCARTFALFMGEADSYEASDVQKMIKLAHTSDDGSETSIKRCPAA